MRYRTFPAMRARRLSATRLRAIGAIALLCAGPGLMPAARAQAIDVIDDQGKPVHLARPAARIVSLAPHVTELLFAAGAGAQVVGVTRFSDHPPEAKKLPLVGDSRAVDFDRLLALNPDLVVVWFHGIALKQIEKIRALGIPSYYSDPKELEDLATSVEKFGALAGTQPAARAWAEAFRRRHQALVKKYSGQRTLKVFYQLWNRPISTLNREHLVSRMIAMCGGTNVFGQAPMIAPVVSVEAVLSANPQAILAGNLDKGRPEWLQDWKKWTEIEAVRAGNLFDVPSDYVNRPGSRALDGAQAICEALETARGRLAAPK